MKLAIPYEEGQIFQHFGKTPAFKIYDIANGQVGGSMVFPTRWARSRGFGWPAPGLGHRRRGLRRHRSRRHRRPLSVEHLPLPGVTGPPTNRPGLCRRQAGG